MTARLLLEEQIERKDALEKMALMRASDAVRRMLLREAQRAPGSEASEPAVAVGVRADAAPMSAAAIARGLPPLPHRRPDARKLAPRSAHPVSRRLPRPRPPATGRFSAMLAR